MTHGAREERRGSALKDERQSKKCWREIRGGTRVGYVRASPPSPLPPAPVVFVSRGDPIQPLPFAQLWRRARQSSIRSREPGVCVLLLSAGKPRDTSGGYAKKKKRTVPKRGRGGRGHSGETPRRDCTARGGEKAKALPVNRGDACHDRSEYRRGPRRWAQQRRERSEGRVTVPWPTSIMNNNKCDDGASCDGGAPEGRRQQDRMDGVRTTWTAPGASMKPGHGLAGGRHDAGSRPRRRLVKTGHRQTDIC